MPMPMPTAASRDSFTSCPSFCRHRHKLCGMRVDDCNQPSDGEHQEEANDDKACTPNSILLLQVDSASHENTSRTASGGKSRQRKRQRQRRHCCCSLDHNEPVASARSCTWTTTDAASTQATASSGRLRCGSHEWHGFGVHWRRGLRTVRPISDRVATQANRRFATPSCRPCSRYVLYVICIAAQRNHCMDRVCCCRYTYYVYEETCLALI